ncbi:hypothetical protein GQ53DRAFT_845077 [Thozetella sp. PMI_491]|nr:hypothetical protein GQ53DRAFT_845077 [Thozetella sp. PMI_491]
MRHHNRAKPKLRFECAHPGCGRSYSRAEHLQRHQLNHYPSEIFTCDHPGCLRAFVRRDLLMRHRERHESRHGSADGQRMTSHATPPGSSSHASDDGVNSPPAGSAGSSKGAGSRGTRLAAEMEVSGPPRGRRGSTHPRPAPYPAPIGRLSTVTDYDGGDEGVPTPYVNYAPAAEVAENALGPLGSPVLTRGDLLVAGASGTSQTTDKHIDDDTSTAFSLNSLPGQGYQAAPTTPARDELTSWLFDGHRQPIHFPLHMQTSLGHPGFSDSIAGQTYFTGHLWDDTHSVAVNQLRLADYPLSYTTAIVDDGPRISHEKWLELLSVVEKRFSGGDNAYINQIRSDIFRGAIDAGEHILSLESMRQYVGSYFRNFHPQLPILHQPTFSTDDVHEYLLLAVLMMGAAYLDRACGHARRDATARLATFIAWHLRWHVFMHTDFQPPAKLWVLQTLLLLEIYDKTDGPRILHERGHLMYATTVNLMRRGTALFDGASTETSRIPASPKEWWDRWITAEATRRVAYGAFYFDAIDAAVFGHAATMVVHEIQLPLPCDDALWSATSPLEAARIQASLHANGIKPIMFLDGLNRIFTGRELRTNHFGRMILATGLMSVSWHMNQRDLQVSSLGVDQSMGSGQWRATLSKAIEFWKKDFDEHMEHARMATLPWQYGEGSAGNEAVAETANLWYHISHITMHAEIYEHQIFAGVRRVLGRQISEADVPRVRRKVSDWATRPGSSIAVFHALKLLRTIFCQPSNVGVRRDYDARDDMLLLRPWCAYIASTIVWSYGPHLCGNQGPSTALSVRVQDVEEASLDAAAKAAQELFQTAGAVKTPRDLEATNNRNSAAGVLLLLSTAFKDSRWELLREVGVLLRNAVTLLEDSNGAIQGLPEKV